MRKLMFMIDDPLHTAVGMVYPDYWQRCPGTCWEVIKHYCLIYGSDVEGRAASYRYYFKRTRKIPVLISSDTCLFSLFACKRRDNIWFNASCITEVTMINANLTRIGFTDGSDMIVNVNKRAFVSQLHKARSFMEVIRLLT